MSPTLDAFSDQMEPIIPNQIQNNNSRDANAIKDVIVVQVIFVIILVQLLLLQSLTNNYEWICLIYWNYPCEF